MNRGPRRDGMGKLLWSVGSTRVAGLLHCCCGTPAILSSSEIAESQRRRGLALDAMERQRCSRTQSVPSGSRVARTKTPNQAAAQNRPVPQRDPELVEGVEGRFNSASRPKTQVSGLHPTAPEIPPCP